MAALAPPFILCPLAESKDLVGFSPDRLENKIILTLDRNIAIRYSVRDQKQETSWTSSRHWFTSKVVFCTDLDKYGAVIDDNIVCLWEENDTTLARGKKYKFTEPIFELVPTSTLGTLLVFRNGFVTNLSKATASKPKSLFVNGPVDVRENSIVDLYLNEDRNTIFLITGAKKPSKMASKCGGEMQKYLKIYPVILGPVEEADEEKSSSPEIFIEAPSNGNILGWCVISNVDTFIVFLKSDGNLYKQSLLQDEKPNESLSNVDQRLADGLPKSVKLASFEKYVNLQNPVVLRPCSSTGGGSGDDSTIICYGSDPSEEGAVVFIHDLTYDLILARQALKLFSLPPIMAKIWSSVFIPQGFNVLVVGIRHVKSLLSSVVGRHQITGIDFFESRDPWKAGWEQKNAQLEPVIKEVGVQDLNESVYDGIDLTDIQDIVNTLERNGHPESLICGQVIPQAVEKGDDTALNWILEYFDDIPEKYLIELLVASLTRRNQGNTADSMDHDFEDGSETLKKIFRRTFDRTELIKNLKSMDYERGKKVLEMLTNLIQDEPLISSNGGDTSNPKNRDDGAVLSVLLKWLGAVLDAQYTNLVFNSETELIDKLLKIVNERTLLLKEIEQLEPLVDMILNKTKLEPRPNPNSIYRVETVVFR